MATISQCRDHQHCVALLKGALDLSLEVGTWQGREGSIMTDESPSKIAVLTRCDERDGLDCSAKAGWGEVGGVSLRMQVLQLCLGQQQKLTKGPMGPERALKRA